MAIIGLWGSINMWTLKVGSGSLQMVGLTSVNGWRFSSQKEANFYLQLTGKMSTCSGADNFGVFVRGSYQALANKGYLYGISCDGKFALRKWNIDTMTVLENWKVKRCHSERIQPGQSVGYYGQGE